MKGLNLTGKIKEQPRGFTLIECLLALLLLSIFFSFSSLEVKYITHLEDYITQQDQKEWIIFQQQLERELADATEVSCSNSRISYRKDGKVFFIEKYQQMLRKTSATGGHQPLLTEIKAVSFTENRTAVQIRVIIQNEQKFYAKWIKEPNR